MGWLIERNTLLGSCGEKCLCAGQHISGVVKRKKHSTKVLWRIGLCAGHHTSGVVNRKKHST